MFVSSKHRFGSVWTGEEVMTMLPSLGWRPHFWVPVVRGLFLSVLAQVFHLDVFTHEEGMVTSDVVSYYILAKKCTGQG